jgi:Na+:H+ antiporter, NhaA family
MALQKFFRSESTPAILLILFALLAMLLKNSSLAEAYNQLLLLDIEVRAESFSIDKPLLLWVNDGLMAVFFFLVGLELKKEVMVGQLSNIGNVILPIAGAIGGVVVPAGIYLLLNYENTLTAHGWAIPTATDIAFSLGILALLGSRVPASLKLFLMTLAIVDDLFGILVIAIFYTSKLSLLTLSIAGIGFLGMAIMNRLRITHIAPFLLCGILVWICFLKSGVHATLACVINAFFIPITIIKADGKNHAHLEELAHDLHPYVYFAVLPMFAFVNAGVILQGMDFSTLTGSIPMGIFLELFVGKQVGIFSICWLVIQCGWAKLPAGCNWRQFYGVSVLCGVGFTMSLFIASLAFGDGVDGSAGQARADRLAILLGSTFSAVMGYLILYSGGNKPNKESPEN